MIYLLPSKKLNNEVVNIINNIYGTHYLSHELTYTERSVKNEK